LWVFFAEVAEAVRIRQVALVLVWATALLVIELDQATDIALLSFLFGGQLLANDPGQRGTRQAGIQFVQFEESGLAGKRLSAHPAPQRIASCDGIINSAPDVLLALIIVPYRPAVRAGVVGGLRQREAVYLMRLSSVRVRAVPMDVVEVEDVLLVAFVTCNRQNPHIGLLQPLFGFRQPLEGRRAAYQHLRTRIPFQPLLEQADRVALPLYIVARVVRFLDDRQAYRGGGLDVTRRVGCHQLEEPAREGLVVP